MLSRSGSRLWRKKTKLRRLRNPAAQPAAPAGLQAGNVTFPVDSVTPASAPLETETLSESLAFRLHRKILVLPGAGQPVVSLYVNIYPATGVGLQTEAKPTRAPLRLVHPLIDAVHRAFSQHRPLILSPDAIWMVIAQGFGHHVAENAEQLRGRLVRHPDKKELRVCADSLTADSFPAVMASFSELIKQETDQVLYETLLCDFSTTTAEIRTASEITLMDTFSSYFEYEFYCVCGIPKITIEGTPEDWKRIRDRVEVVATYGLEWWVSRLRTILDEFVAAAEGRANRDFWKAIYKPKAAYAAEIVTGWIADLFPYLGDPPQRSRNAIFNTDRRDWLVPVQYGLETRWLPAFDPKKDSGVSRKLFPSGLSSARLKLVLPGGETMEKDLLGGFLAIRQHAADLFLSPLIGWCLADLPPEKLVMVH